MSLELGLRDGGLPLLAEGGGAWLGGAELVLLSGFRLGEDFQAEQECIGFVKI